MAKMAKAYAAASKLIGAELEEKEPEKAKAMRKLTKKDIVVVEGDYDHIENILRRSKTPFTLIQPADVATYALSPEQIMFVNCLEGGKYHQKGIDNIRSYVRKAGFLTTTDWALKYVVQRAFPGYIKHNGVETGNDVVQVQFVSQNPLVAGLQGTKPQWWLEDCSYPIRILKPRSVEVLIDSAEMRQKYKDGAIAVTFGYYKGRVLHMVSHYHLQQTRNRRKMSAGQFAKDILGLSAGQVSKLEQDLKGVSADEIEAAYASQRLVQNVITGRR